MAQNNDFDVVVLFQNWLNAEIGMQTAPYWNNGWERWAQGQWAIHLEQTYGYNVTVEQRVYFDREQRADFLIQAAGFNAAIVELKCFLSGKDPTESADEFSSRVLEDKGKLEHQLDGVYHGFPIGTKLWAVGLSVTGPAVRTQIGEQLVIARGLGHTTAIGGSVDIWDWTGHL